MNAESMKTYTIGLNTFAIFEKSEKQGEWMLQFIWGKKDFRIALGKSGSAKGLEHGPVVQSEKTGDLVVTGLQYMNAYVWYDYDSVSGHGLAMEEVRWRYGKTRRYVELPQNFLDTAVDLACREFELEPVKAQKAG